MTRKGPTPGETVEAMVGIRFTPLQRNQVSELVNRIWHMAFRQGVVLATLLYAAIALLIAVAWWLI